MRRKKHSKYRGLLPEQIAQAPRLCFAADFDGRENRRNDEEIAADLEIARGTLARRKNRPDFKSILDPMAEEWVEGFRVQIRRYHEESSAKAALIGA